MTDRTDPATWNPLDGDIARAHSSYSAFDGKHLLRADDSGPGVSPIAEYVHDALRALVLNPRFTCVGAKSAFHCGGYAGHTCCFKVARKGLTMDSARRRITKFCTSFVQVIRNNPKGAVVIAAFLGIVGLLEGGRIVEEIKNPRFGKNLFGKT